MFIENYPIIEEKEDIIESALIKEGNNRQEEKYNKGYVALFPFAGVNYEKPS